MNTPLTGLFKDYQPLLGRYDEMFLENGQPQPAFYTLLKLLDKNTLEDFQHYRRLADTIFRNNGTTFLVYKHELGTEEIFPFDLIPRVICACDWRQLEKGLLQRVQALELFLHDIYGEQKILKDKIIPHELIESSAGYNPRMCHITPPGGIYINISGIDLIKTNESEYCVLEDNLRTPSGVSYVLENRLTMKRVFPAIFKESHIRTIKEYPLRFKDALTSLSAVDNPMVVILTPGVNNSAFFEHSYLARKMGCYLVQGSDLFVHQEKVYVKTTEGPKRVDVIYRRVDDDYIDPNFSGNHSMLGVPDLMKAYIAGNVVLANGIGNGVADDKAIYSFVPQMIRYYLTEEPILPQVPTYLGFVAKEKDYILQHLDKLVVKKVDGAGGYGMLFGPHATQKERIDFAEKIKANPRDYIAQEVVELSTCPTWDLQKLAPKRVDFRPYIVSGKYRWVLPGGLTRVALAENSYIVNSSQGGGSKDTWVLNDEDEYVQGEQA